MATASTESAALAAALSAMLSAPGNQLARHARAVSRAADDAEVAAAEAPEASTRRALMEQVDTARGAAVEAREQARRVAMEKGREELMDGVVERKPDGAGTAAGIAKDINDGLRRVTAVVKEEVDRSEAAGGVVEESGRRLRMTRDRHVKYGDVLRSGSGTLGELKRVEIVANVAVAVSFLFFIFVAVYVVNRKLANSNSATFLVRPGLKIVSAPARLVVRLMRFVTPIFTPKSGKGLAEVTGIKEIYVQGDKQEGVRNNNDLDANLEEL